MHVPRVPANSGHNCIVTSRSAPIDSPFVMRAECLQLFEPFIKQTFVRQSSFLNTAKPRSQEEIEMECHRGKAEVS